jgi:hypothetical protein
LYASSLKEGDRLYSWLLLQGNIPVLVDEKRPLYNTAERDSLVIKREYCTRRFDLGKPEDLDAYTKVMERIVARWYVQLVKKDVTPKDSEMPAYWLEWVVQYYTRNA